MEAVGQPRGIGGPNGRFFNQAKIRGWGEALWLIGQDQKKAPFNILKMA